MTRTCNHCMGSAAGDNLGFEGSFIDWNYDLDICVECVIMFKKIIDAYCGTDNIDTSTELTEIEKAEREPVSKANKKLREKMN